MSATGRRGSQTSQEISAGSCSLPEPNFTVRVRENDNGMLLWLQQQRAKMLEKRNIAEVVGDGAVSMPSCCKIFPTMKAVEHPPYQVRIWMIPMASLTTAMMIERLSTKDGRTVIGRNVFEGVNTTRIYSLLK